MIFSFLASDVITINPRISDHEVTPSPKVFSTSLKTLEVTSSNVVATSFGGKTSIKNRVSIVIMMIIRK